MIRWLSALLVVAAVAMLSTPAAGLARADEKKSDPDKQKKEAPEEERGFLGVNPGGEQDGGVTVESVVDDGPAAKAGIKAGDTIVKFNDKDVKSSDDLREQIGSVKPGQTVTVTVKRDNKEMKIKVTLGKRPKDEG